MLFTTLLNKSTETTQGNFGIYIIDLDTSKILYDLNSEELFPSASVAKIFVAGCVQELLNQKALSLGNTLKQTSEDLIGGSGVIQYLDRNREFSISELVNLMIIESDNIATKMLLRRINPEKVNEIIKKQNSSAQSFIKVEEGKFVGWGMTSPKEAGEYLVRLCEKQTPISSALLLKDSSDYVGHAFGGHGLDPNIKIYSKTGTLYPKVKNTVAMINSNNKKVLISYFSKDLDFVGDSENILRKLSFEVKSYLETSA